MISAQRRHRYLIRCDHCNAALSGEVSCKHCGVRQDLFVDERAPIEQLTDPEAQFHITDHDNGRTIVWVWATVNFWCVLFFLAAVYVLTFSALNGWLAAVLGVTWGYFAVAGFLNQNSFHANRHRLSLSVGPLPIPFSRPLVTATDDIDQLLIVVERRTRRGHVWYLPKLLARTRSGGWLTLTTGASDREFADYEYLRSKLLEALAIDPDKIVDNPFQKDDDDRTQLLVRIWDFLGPLGRLFIP